MTEKWYDQSGNVDGDVTEKWYDQSGNVDGDVRERNGMIKVGMLTEM